MVYMFLADGFEEIEALYTLDILRRASVEILTVGISGKTATGSHNITVSCDILASELDLNSDFEMVILPGGMPGATNLDADSVVDKALAVANENDKFICAICAAPFILGKRGLLVGKMATCFPGFEDQLLGATIADCGCVRDGKVITGRAMGSAHEFALEILRALCGDEVAEKMKATILLA